MRSPTPLANPSPGTPPLPAGAGAPAPPAAGPRPVVSSYGGLLAQTMLLVGGALGVFALGAVAAPDLGLGASLLVGVGALAGLIALAVLSPLRRGTNGVALLFGIALAFGIAIAGSVARDGAAATDWLSGTFGMIVVVLLAAAAAGSWTSHDVPEWMRPVTLVGAVVGIGAWLAAAGASTADPRFTGAAGAFIAALVLIDFHFLRRRAASDDVVYLATGVFLTIAMVFIALATRQRPRIRVS